MLNKLTLPAIALLFSGASVAAGPSVYQDLDADQDGAISQKEAAAMPKLTNKWQELDANADGKLDEAEFAKFEMIAE